MAQQYDAATKYGTGRKTITSYMWGLGLSLLFTGLAFAVTTHSIFTNTAAIYISLAVLAFSQFVAQVVCFLRMNATPGGRWNLFPFLFTIIVAAVLIGGSIWIMVNLNYNMM